MDQTNERARRDEPMSAEQRSERRIREMELAGVLSRDDEPQAVREMTPDEIRHDELARLLDFAQGDPVDQTTPSRDELEAGIKFRMEQLVPGGWPEPGKTPSAEQPLSEPEMVTVPRSSAEAAGLAYTLVGPEHKIRADELSNLVAWLEGEHPSSGDEVIRSIRDRIGFLLDEPPSVEQPSNAAARISGAIAAAARELDDPLERIRFLTEVVETTSRLVAETPPIHVRFGHPQTLEEAAQNMEAAAPEDAVRHMFGHLTESLAAVERSVVLPTAIEFLNGPSADHIEPTARRQLATSVAISLNQRV